MVSMVLRGLLLSVVLSAPLLRLLLNKMRLPGWNCFLGGGRSKQGLWRRCFLSLLLVVGSLPLTELLLSWWELEFVVVQLLLLVPVEIDERHVNVPTAVGTSGSETLTLMARGIAGLQRLIRGLSEPVRSVGDLRLDGAANSGLLLTAIRR